MSDMDRERTDEQQDISFVRITNREIYDSIRSLERNVVNMDQRMNDILRENVDARARIRSLELKVYTILAGFTTAVTAAGVALLRGTLR